MMWQKTKKIVTGLGILSVITLSIALVVNHQAGSRLLSVQSESMVPALHKGDLVRVTRVPQKDLRVGDVITFINPEDKKSTISHRIIAINLHAANGNTITTKGDANLLPDIAIEASSVVGRVDQHVSYAGFAVNFLKSWPGLILILYIPALIIMYAELKRLAVYFKSQKPYMLLEYERRRQKNSVFGRQLLGGTRLTIFALILLGVFAVVPAYAALQNKSNLVGNSISVRLQSNTPDNSGCTITNTGLNSTNTCTHNSTTTCSTSNSNNVNVDNNSNQTSSTGSSSSTGNSTANDAASGSSSNINSTSSNISVENSNNCKNTTSSQP